MVVSIVHSSICMNCVAYSISSLTETRDRALSFSSEVDLEGWFPIAFLCVAYSISSLTETRDRALSFLWEVDLVGWFPIACRGHRLPGPPETTTMYAARQLFETVALHMQKLNCGVSSVFFGLRWLQVVIKRESLQTILAASDQLGMLRLMTMKWHRH